MRELLDIVFLDNDSILKILNLRKKYLNGTRLTYIQCLEIFNQLGKFPRSLNTPFLNKKESVQFNIFCKNGEIKKFSNMNDFHSDKDFNLESTYSIRIDDHHLDPSFFNEMEDQFIEEFLKQLNFGINKLITDKKNVEDLYLLVKTVIKSRMLSSKFVSEKTLELLELFIKNSNIKYLLQFNDQVRQTNYF